MKQILGLIIPFLLYGGHAHAGDGFQAVRCGADIPKALVGKRLSNERVVVIEGRHPDLALKDLGADEISDRLNSISWLICGKEFLMLVDSQSRIRDVLPFPPHSKSSPAFGGTCRLKDREVPETIVAVLASGTGTEAWLPAKDAWKIDEKIPAFVKIPTESLLCPRHGVITLDGGL